MLKPYLILIVLTLFSFVIKAQEEVVKENKNSVFVEVLGATGYLSLNYDRTIALTENLFIRTGAGVGYVIKTDYTPYVLSYTAKLDLQYGNKKINPVVGYSFSQNFELEDTDNIYLIHSPNIGVNIKVLDRINLLPKYYFMLVNEPNYNGKYTIHWYGLQIRYNF